MQISTTESPVLNYNTRVSPTNLPISEANSLLMAGKAHEVFAYTEAHRFDPGLSPLDSKTMGLYNDLATLGIKIGAAKGDTDRVNGYLDRAIEIFRVLEEMGIPEASEMISRLSTLKNQLETAPATNNREPYRPVFVPNS